MLVIDQFVFSYHQHHHHRQHEKFLMNQPHRLHRLLLLSSQQ
jgi:hypothetical protein